jgi:hypothetical protein
LIRGPGSVSRLRIAGGRAHHGGDGDSLTAG